MLIEFLNRFSATEPCPSKLDVTFSVGRKNIAISARLLKIISYVLISSNQTNRIILRFGNADVSHVIFFNQSLNNLYYNIFEVAFPFGIVRSMKTLVHLLVRTVKSLICKL